MQITKELIHHVATISRLKLTPQETEKFLNDFKNILATFSIISKVDTTNTPPSFQPIPIKNVMREDIITPSFLPQDALKNTPHKKDTYFKGPGTT